MTTTGVAKQRQAQQSQEQQQQQQVEVPPQLPGANATGAVEMRLPFRVSAALEAPAGALKAYTCDMLFSTDQVWSMCMKCHEHAVRHITN